MNKECYLLWFPRPIGCEPTVYLQNPNINLYSEDPFSPDVIKCRDIKSALELIIEFNSSDDYLKELTIK